MCTQKCLQHKKKRIELKVIGVRIDHSIPLTGVSRKRHPVCDHPIAFKVQIRFTVSVKLCVVILVWKLPSGHRLFVTIFGTCQNVRLAVEHHIWRAASSYVIFEYQFINGHRPWRRWRRRRNVFIISWRLWKQRQQRNNKSHHQLLATGHERARATLAVLGHRARRDVSCDERL